MIRAYVAPTEQTAIWVTLPYHSVESDVIHGDTIELTLDESAELREQLHHAERTASNPCDLVASCTRHACYDDGGCHEHGRAL